MTWGSSTLLKVKCSCVSMMRKVQTKLIQAAISTLDPDHREALVLHDVEGLSAEEAAAVAGIEVPALKSRLRRARTALKQQLAAVLDEKVPEPVKATVRQALRLSALG